VTASGVINDRYGEEFVLTKRHRSRWIFRRSDCEPVATFVNKFLAIAINDYAGRPHFRSRLCAAVLDRVSPVAVLGRLRNTRRKKSKSRSCERREKRRATICDFEL